MAILSPIIGPATSILSAATSQAWGPLVSLCRSGALAQLQGIKVGKLVLYEIGSSKTTSSFGKEESDLPLAILQVHDDKFWVRLALFADMVRAIGRLLVVAAWI